ncbi:hypothetical protein Ancab_016838 [Ancistrocladus abbreviatus]
MRYGLIGFQGWKQSLDIVQEPSCVKKPFKIINMWADHVQFLAIIWEESGEMQGIAGANSKRLLVDPMNNELVGQEKSLKPQLMVALNDEMGPRICPDEVPVSFGLEKSCRIRPPVSWVLAGTLLCAVKATPDTAVCPQVLESSCKWCKAPIRFNSSTQCSPLIRIPNAGNNPHSFRIREINFWIMVVAENPDRGSRIWYSCGNLELGQTRI